MGDDRGDADALNSGGEDPAAESGAGYGSHAPEPAPEPDEAEERSKQGDG